MDCSAPGSSVLHYLLEFAQTHVHWGGDGITLLILSHPLLLLPSIFPSIRVFSSEWAVCIRWPNCISLSISPSSEYSELISFRIDWFFLSCSPRDSQESSPAPQFESINSWVLCLLYGLALTSVHDYWKDHSLDYMDLCQRSDIFVFNTLSRFTIAFLARSNRLLISWLHPQWF